MYEFATCSGCSSPIACRDVSTCQVQVMKVAEVVMRDNSAVIVTYYLVEHPLGNFFGAVTHPRYYEPIEQVKLAWGHASRYTRFRVTPDHSLPTISLTIRLPDVKDDIKKKAH